MSSCAPLRARNLLWLTLAALLLLLLGLAALLGVTRVRAAAAGEASAGPTVVRELTERRTAYGSTYLLSNGAYRAVLSQAPVHYQDARGA